MNMLVMYEVCYTKLMTSGGKSFNRRVHRWFDEWRLAGAGVVLATRKRTFVITFLLSFVIFGTLMNLLSGSTASLGLFWNVDLAGKLKIIGDAFLGVFGIGRSFWDWLLLFSITIIQSILIALVALVWQHRRRSKKEQILATAANSDNVQSAGLAAGLAVLGSGCPTCGTTLLAPMLGTLFSTSSYALAGIISGLLTFAAVIVALLSIKRLGNEVYALIVSERYLKKQAKSSKQENL